MSRIAVASGLAIGLSVAILGCAGQTPAAPVPSVASGTPALPSEASAGVGSASPTLASAAPSTLPSTLPSPAPVAPGSSAGDTRIDAAGVTQVWVPAGSFPMGTTSDQAAAVLAADPPAWVRNELSSEQPEHQVTLSRGYWIDRDEVTNAAYDAFVAAGGYTTRAWWSDAGWAWLQAQATALPAACDAAAPDEPRACVTWFEAEAFAAWRGGRLPTEAEWEYAARGPDGHIYPWGDRWDPSHANVVDATAAVKVGSYRDGVSWVGATDLAGNVMEWVADWLAPYDAAPATDPTGPTSGAIKVEKGGWWGSNEWVARSAYRHFEDPPGYQDHHIGFRVVTAASQ